MRIISGKYKGKKLLAPKRLSARPTTDYAKESLFNILSNSYDFDELRVLDLFTGTGNIALEFASRGAQRVIAVDIERASTQFVIRMARETDAPIYVEKHDVFKYLKNHTETYDIIFADPPYNHSRMSDIPTLVFENGLLNEHGMLIVEHDEYTSLKGLPHFVEERRYGKAHFSFFEL